MNHLKRSLLSSQRLPGIWVAAFTQVLICVFVMASPVIGQEDDLPEGVVPPPLTAMAEEDEEKIEAEKSASKRTKLVIELMESRLVNSKGLSSEDKFGPSLEELARFKALMNTTLRDLLRNSYNRKGLRNNKRFEMALRGFLPRLVLVRRSLPSSHAYHVTKLIESVREARQRLIEPFFEDTVIPNTDGN